MDVFWARVRGRLHVTERSQAWLARRIGVNRQSLNQWILGTRRTPHARREQVAGLLGIRTNDIDGGKAA